MIPRLPHPGWDDGEPSQSKSLCYMNHEILLHPFVNVKCAWLITRLTLTLPYPAFCG
jgi:hypothetical protein